MYGIRHSTSFSPGISDLAVKCFLFIYMWISGWVLSLFPSMVAPSVVVFTAIILIGLDSFSIYEDKSRFSEITGYDYNHKSTPEDPHAYSLSGEPAKPWYFAMQALSSNEKYRDKMTGRKNALWTGIASHILDTATLFVAGLIFLKRDRFTNLTSQYDFWLWVIICSTIAGIGILWIYNLTKDGGPSDLRNKSDQEKCVMNRIMTDKSRGTANLFISFVAIIAGWQAIIGGIEGFYENPTVFKTEWYKAPIQLIGHFFKSGMSKNDPILKKIGKGFSKLMLTAGPALGATVMNYINSSFQFNSETDEQMNLPPCFD